MFETSLAASRPQPTQRNRKLLPVALAAHGALLAGVVLAGYWTVSDVPEPDSMIGVVFNAGGPPPPLGGGDRPKPRAPQAAEPPRTAPPREVVQPPATELPDLPPIASAPGADDSTNDSTVSLYADRGGDGSPFGVKGGTGDGSGIGDGPPIDDAPIVIRAGVTPPQLLSRAMPRYTEAARRARREGSVFLEAIIDKSGRVADLRVLKAVGFGLDEEAIHAVSQWLYRPARLGERDIAVYLTVRVDFRLQ